MRFAFVMDPVERIRPDKDTTFVFMLESARRGHEVFCFLAEDLFIEDHAAHGRGRRIEVRRPSGASAEPHFRFFEERITELTWFDALFMRKDPPFDLAYYVATQILGLVDPGRTFVINDPRGLREASEKLYALRFPGISPPSLVSADPLRIKDFMERMGGEAVLKPLDACGGAGVFHLGRGDRNVNAILEGATDNGRRPVMAQRYLADVRNGDKRILLVDGEPVGALLRVPPPDDHRSNLHVGGQGKRTEITARDREICAVLAPHLRADGLYFVGLDVIGGWLTEVNVTSPTGIQEVNVLDGVQLESRVIDFVEQRARQLAR